MKKSRLFLLLALVIHNGYVLADIKSNEARAILRASIKDTSQTDHEKLFVYRCKMTEKYLGFKNTATGKATQYSCDRPEIGIALYAGKDLGEHSPEDVAKYFRNELKKHHIKAEVFIHHKHPHGSSITFYIDGESWLRDPVNPLEGIKQIKKLAREALLLLYTAGRIEWPKEIKRPKDFHLLEKMRKSRG